MNKPSIYEIIPNRFKFRISGNAVSTYDSVTMPVSSTEVLSTTNVLYKGVLVMFTHPGLPSNHREISRKLYRCYD